MKIMVKIWYSNAAQKDAISMQDDEGKNIDTQSEYVMLLVS
jgi:ribosomal protein S4E